MLVQKGMRNFREIVQALKKGEEVTIEVKLEFDERHILLLAGILTTVVLNLMVF
ncbi:hypothetical protein [Solitalea agri]|nr:hypothetical protein [Solitalea agri]